ncbi:MAG: site-2 protease family protein [Holosporaceae bacterium]|jgi:Zn-dependent protease|nr:site-2 protease family protein [Holosporaceae bacterium]
MPFIFDLLLLNILPLFVAIVLHEISHGVVAYWLGDDTAQKAGRFKLFTHFDLFGSFLIPLGLYLMNSPFLAGYAKPVPINVKKFKDPMTDMALVALAGPLCNLILAFLTAFILKNIHMSAEIFQEDIIAKLTFNFLVVNLALFWFNLIPIPPLDGSRILATFLPVRAAMKFYALESFGIFIIIGIELICSPISQIVGHNVGLLENLVKTPLLFTIRFLLS